MAGLVWSAYSGEVHHGLLPHPQEVLEEWFTADSNDHVAKG